MKLKKEEQRQVVVTTQYRGVYHGTMVFWDRKNRDCILTDANMIGYWGTTKGVDQLSNTGPTDKSRVFALAKKVWIPGLTSIVDCTREANEKWAQYKTA